MNGVLGEAVISDFDGTLAQLEISWQSLRDELAVDRIEEIWHDPDTRRWETVTRAEVAAAAWRPPSRASCRRSRASRRSRS